MRLVEFAEGFQIYAARVRVKNPLYTNSIDVAVFAKNPSMARALLRAQYAQIQWSQMFAKFRKL